MHNNEGAAARTEVGQNESRNSLYLSLSFLLLSDTSLWFVFLYKMHLLSNLTGTLRERIYLLAVLAYVSSLKPANASTIIDVSCFGRHLSTDPFIGILQFLKAVLLNNEIFRDVNMACCCLFIIIHGMKNVKVINALLRWYSVFTDK